MSYQDYSYTPWREVFDLMAEHQLTVIEAGVLLELRWRLTCTNSRWHDPDGVYELTNYVTDLSIDELVEYTKADRAAVEAAVERLDALDLIEWLRVGDEEEGMHHAYKLPSPTEEQIVLSRIENQKAREIIRAQKAREREARQAKKEQKRLRDQAGGES